MIEQRPTLRQQLIRAVTTLARDHPALFITIIYSYLSLVGFAYGSALLAQFGVDFVDYSELSDYAYIAIKFPYTFNYILVAAVMMATMLFIMHFLPRSNAFFPHLYSKSRRVLFFFTRLLIPVVTVAAVTSPFVFSRRAAWTQAEAIKSPHSNIRTEPSAFLDHVVQFNKFMRGQTPIDITTVRVTLSSDEYHEKAYNSVVRLIFANSNYYFFYDPKDSKVLVFPKSRVTSLSYDQSETPPTNKVNPDDTSKTTGG